MLKKWLAPCSTLESTWSLLLYIIFTRFRSDQKYGISAISVLKLPNLNFPALIEFENFMGGVLLSILQHLFQC